VEGWLARDPISERLRQRVGDEKILFHHKFRIAIAGCPNGCSRPQIADVGLVGFVTPEADTQACTGCGACVRACPDGAIALGEQVPVFDRRLCQGCTRCRAACAKQCIRLSPAGIRILAGGKLGRHPHLAEVVCEVRTPAEAIEFLGRAITAFAARDDSHQRFADFWVHLAPEKRRLIADCGHPSDGPEPQS
jgi:dissimilatory sulfite reductase (desulfoviridin) alpha/beta subunit